MLPFENPIVSIEYNTGELIPELADTLRNTIVDVRCTDTEGRQFIVEMQMYWSESFKSRVLLNASKAYIMQLDQSKDFDLLQPVYALNFVNEIFEKDPNMANEYFHHYKIVNIKNTEKQVKGLEFIFLELPKFKPVNSAEKKLHNLWLTFLTNVKEDTEEIPQELLDNELTREAVEYMKRAAYTKKELAAYDKWKIDIMTERSVINDAIRKGLAEGMEKGKAEGIVEGIEKGEKLKAIEIAKNAKTLGLPIEQIQHLTNLSTKEIEKL
jgi:predicted transposase/invertase (TIGR01784 family)